MKIQHAKNGFKFARLDDFYILIAAVQLHVLKLFFLENGHSQAWPVAIFSLLQSFSLIMNIQLPLIQNTWGWARDQDLPHVLAWCIGSDYSYCTAFEIFYWQHCFLNCRKYKNKKPELSKKQKNVGLVWDISNSQYEACTEFCHVCYLTVLTPFFHAFFTLNSFSKRVPFKPTYWTDAGVQRQGPGASTVLWQLSVSAAATVKLRPQQQTLLPTSVCCPPGESCTDRRSFE